MNHINGVEIHDLSPHADVRGFLMELFHESDQGFEGFAQIYMSKNHPGTIRAWHWHEQQTDFWVCVCGNIQVGLCDMREDSPTHMQSMSFVIGDDRKASVVIPPGVMHGFKAIGNETSIMLNMTNRFYDPSDEFRKPWKFDPVGTEDFWTVKYT